MKIASEPWNTVLEQAIGLLRKACVRPVAAEEHAGSMRETRLGPEERAQAGELLLVRYQLEQPTSSVSKISRVAVSSRARASLMSRLLPREALTC